MSWGDAIGWAGIAIDAFGSYKQSEAAEKRGDEQATAIRETAAANAEISYYDAAIAEREGNAALFSSMVELRNHRVTVDKLMGSMKAKMGKSGAVVGKGSSLDVMARTAGEAARDAEIIRYNGQTKAQRYRSMAVRYRKLAQAGLRDAALTASLQEEAATATSTAIRIGGIADTLKGIYKLTA